jgi:hypothetical protein
MNYFFVDLKKIVASKIMPAIVIILLAVMVFDPIWMYCQGIFHEGFFDDIGGNPYQYWLLTNFSGWGHAFYYTLLWIFPILLTGLIYLREKNSQCCKLLVIRGDKARYFIAKICSAFTVSFLTIVLLLIINIMITYLIFSDSGNYTEQYNFFVPNEGTFAYGIFRYSPFMLALVYTFMNAFAIGMLSAVSVELNMVFNYKNTYVAIIVPVLLYYAIGYISDTLAPAMHKYSLSLILQPLATKALTTVIDTGSVLITFGVWLTVAVALYFVCLYRNKDVI